MTFLDNYLMHTCKEHVFLPLLGRLFCRYPLRQGDSVDQVLYILTDVPFVCFID
jgi:hypothetical protein